MVFKLTKFMNVYHTIEKVAPLVHSDKSTNFLLLLHYWARPGQGMFLNGHDGTSIVSLILKINALPRCGPIRNFAMKVEGVLVMLLCCTELGNHMYPGTLQGLTFGLIPNNKDFHHGHILIETETYSFRLN